MSTPLGLLAAPLLLVTAIAMASTSDRPVTLSAERNGGQAVLTVTGASDETVTVAYDLQVTGASRVHQKGRATLRAGETAKLVQVGISPAEGWKAVLTVAGQNIDYTVTLPVEG